MARKQFSNWSTIRDNIQKITGSTVNPVQRISDHICSKFNVIGSYLTNIKGFFGKRAMPTRDSYELLQDYYYGKPVKNTRQANGFRPVRFVPYDGRCVLYTFEVPWPKRTHIRINHDPFTD